MGMARGHSGCWHTPWGRCGCCQQGPAALTPQCSPQPRCWEGRGVAHASCGVTHFLFFYSEVCYDWCCLFFYRFFKISNSNCHIFIVQLCLFFTLCPLGTCTEFPFDFTYFFVTLLGFYWGNKSAFPLLLFFVFNFARLFSSFPSTFPFTFPLFFFFPHSLLFPHPLLIFSLLSPRRFPCPLPNSRSASPAPSRTAAPLPAPTSGRQFS